MFEDKKVTLKAHEVKIECHTITLSPSVGEKGIVTALSFVQFIVASNEKDYKLYSFIEKVPTYCIMILLYSGQQ